jgi:hypothetical protein
LERDSQRNGSSKPNCDREDLRASFADTSLARKAPLTGMPDAKPDGCFGSFYQVFFNRAHYRRKEGQNLMHKYEQVDNILGPDGEGPQFYAVNTVP